MDDLIVFSSLISKRFLKQHQKFFYYLSRLIKKDTRHDLYNLYGLIILIKQIINQPSLEYPVKYLNEVREETVQAFLNQYSTNLIVMSFVRTAKKNQFDLNEILDLFQAAKLDLRKTKLNQKKFDLYIHGSAEVISLMILRVFMIDEIKIRKLETNARLLGSIYQRINLIINLKKNYENLGYFYWPLDNYQQFDESYKKSITNQIDRDFATVRRSIELLPRNCRLIVLVSYDYYYYLFKKIKRYSVNDLKQKPIKASRLIQSLIILKNLLKIV